MSSPEPCFFWYFPSFVDVADKAHPTREFSSTTFVVSGPSVSYRLDMRYIY